MHSIGGKWYVQERGRKATTGGKEGVGKNSIAVGFYRTIFFIYHIDVLFILK
jgi:hypothetical protein